MASGRGSPHPRGTYWRGVHLHNARRLEIGEHVEIVVIPIAGCAALVVVAAWPQVPRAVRPPQGEQLCAGRRDRPPGPPTKMGSSHYPVCSKPAITLSGKDWHSSANRAVL